MRQCSYDAQDHDYRHFFISVIIQWYDNTEHFLLIKCSFADLSFDGLLQILLLDVDQKMTANEI